jgi:hypothetical protein
VKLAKAYGFGKVGTETPVVGVWEHVMYQNTVCDKDISDFLQARRNANEKPCILFFDLCGQMKVDFPKVSQTQFLQDVEYSLRRLKAKDIVGIHDFHCSVKLWQVWLRLAKPNFY